MARHRVWSSERMLGALAIQRALDLGPWKAFREGMRIFSNDLKISPNSVDVSLGNSFLVPNYNGIVDPCDERTLTWESIIDNHYILKPQEFLLAVTRERFETTEQFEGKYYTQQYEGRSTMGRIGLMSHITAGFGDYGFAGCFTLELYNVAPFSIVLHAGMRIGQIIFEEVIDPNIYSGVYVGSESCHPVAPVLGQTRMF